MPTQLISWLIVLFVLILVIGIMVLLRHLAIKRFRQAVKRAGYHESWSDTDGSIQKDILYDPKSGNGFDLYIPANPDPIKTQNLILFIHGGSWLFGNKNQIAYAAKRYAKAGYLTASMDYSLLSKESPEVDFFTMRDEIHLCIQKIKSHCEAQGINIKKIALSGISAGGHLAMLYGYAQQHLSPISIAFLAIQTGPSDFQTKTNKRYQQALFNFITRRTGIDLKHARLDSEEVKAIKRQASPISYIKEDSPPTLLAYGKRDKIVPFKNHDLLVQALENAKVPFTSIPFPNSGHLLADDPVQRDAYHTAFLDYADRYFS